MTRLEGKTAVITGAASGIGLETALALARGGDHIVLADRNVAGGEAALARITGAGGRAEFRELDLADLNSVVSFANSVRAATSRIDALVLNAGLLTDHGQRTAQGLEASFGVIHLGHHLLTRELWPLLVEASVLREHVQEASDTLMQRFEMREALSDEKDELDMRCVRMGKLTFELGK